MNDLPRDHDHQPPRELWPAHERKKRIVWRTVAISAFLVLCFATQWLANRQGWSWKAAVAIVAVAYWAAVTAIWKRRGPYMPGLHDQRTDR